MEKNGNKIKIKKESEKLLKKKRETEHNWVTSNKVKSRDAV